MGHNVIAGIVIFVVRFTVMVIVIILSAGRQIAKDCRALSVRYQRLARRADCNATTIPVFEFPWTKIPPPPQSKRDMQWLLVM